MHEVTLTLQGRTLRQSDDKHNISERLPEPLNSQNSFAKQTVTAGTPAAQDCFPKPYAHNFNVHIVRVGASNTIRKGGPGLCTGAEIMDRLLSPQSSSRRFRVRVPDLGCQPKP